MTTRAIAAWEPPGWRKIEPKSSDITTNSVAASMSWTIKFYQKTISRIDGDRCPSYPTCSAYALEALQNHGFFLGTALTAGRLLSEADEAAFAPRVYIGGKWKIYAPVKRDFLFWLGDENN